MKTVKYVGVFEEVEIEVAPQLYKNVAKNETVDVSDKLAESLTTQVDNWVEIKSKKKGEA